MEDKLRLYLIQNIKKKERWYFGGIASCLVTLLVHPLDTIKVQLQTHQGKNIGVFTVGKDIVRKGGITALYNGLSASLTRQMFYSGSRFGLYGAIRNYLSEGGRKQGFLEKAGGAAVAGSFGAFIGTPWDVINVRMQNDIKLPPDQRRNYKWAGDGLRRILKEEGYKVCFKGASFVAVRGAFMTIGQCAFYDTIKSFLLGTSYFDDNITTHFTSSIGAAFIATLLTQPLDVVKTRMMQGKPGQYKNYLHIIKDVAKEGPVAFYKGFIPSSIRIVPGTIATFIVLEQIIKYFGYEEKTADKMSFSGIATLLTQPLDVIKTRIMNAKPGLYSGYGDVIVQTAKTGPTAFIKGITPAFIRIAPMTVGVFLTLEQMTKYFGIPA